MVSLLPVSLFEQQFTMVTDEANLHVANVLMLQTKVQICDLTAGGKRWTFLTFASVLLRSEQL